MKFIAVVNNKKNITEIANRLKAMGCTINQVLKHTGVITGDSGTHPLSALQVKGLRSVEEDRKITL